MMPATFNPASFTLHPGHFDHQSLLHGINHTYRVMVHCLNLGQSLQLETETKLAFCAAFIHDMSRKHDGFCTQHGQWSSEFKLPEFKDFFLSQGVNSYELEIIRVAVKNHSIGFNLEKEDPAYLTACLLKDSDALDRIRLGAANLNTDFLRLETTQGYIPFANELYQHSKDSVLTSFNEILAIANKLKHYLPD